MVKMMQETQWQISHLLNRQALQVTPGTASSSNGGAPVTIALTAVDESRAKLKMTVRNTRRYLQRFESLTAQLSTALGQEIGKLDDLLEQI